MREAKSEYYVLSLFTPSPSSRSNSSRHLARKSLTSKSYRCGRKWRCSFKCAFPRSRKTLRGAQSDQILPREETHHYHMRKWQINRCVNPARSSLNFSPNEARVMLVSLTQHPCIACISMSRSSEYHILLACWTRVLHLDNYLRPVTYDFLVTAHNSYIHFIRARSAPGEFRDSFIVECFHFPLAWRNGHERISPSNQFIIFIENIYLREIRYYALFIALCMHKRPKMIFRYFNNAK